MSENESISILIDTAKLRTINASINDEGEVEFNATVDLLAGVKKISSLSVCSSSYYGDRKGELTPKARRAIIKVFAEFTPIIWRAINGIMIEAKGGDIK